MKETMKKETRIYIQKVWKNESDTCEQVFKAAVQYVNRIKAVLKDDRISMTGKITEIMQMARVIYDVMAEAERYNTRADAIKSLFYNIQQQEE